MGRQGKPNQMEGKEGKCELIEQYRPRTLDDLHYHGELSNRLKSLVSYFRLWQGEKLNM